MAIHKIQIPGATSAEAINAHALVDDAGSVLNIGSATTPVYFSNGIPVAGNALPTIPSTLPNPSALTITGNGTQGISYNGSSAVSLDFKTNGFATVTGSSGAITFDTKIRKVASLAEATDTSCVYLIPSSSGNLQQSYIIASSAPSDTTKIWIDSANSNIAKVWNGSAWSTLGAVWS